MRHQLAICFVDIAPSPGHHPRMAIDELHREFGQRLKALRKRQDLTQEDLARKAGLSVETISNLERGALTTRLSTIKIIADELGVKILALLDDDHLALAESPQLGKLV